MALEKILKNSSGIPTGEYERISGGTLYADTPVGVIQSFGGSAIPTGWLLCDGAEKNKADYPELYAVIGDAFGTASVNTKFVLPDLREATTKGAGETGKTVGAHVKSGGLAVGEFLDDRVQEHTHRRNANWGNFTTSNFPAGADGQTGAEAITFGEVYDARKGATTEVKSVGVNYIIKSKQVALPADLESAVEDAVGEVMSALVMTKTVQGSTSAGNANAGTTIPTGYKPFRVDCSNTMYSAIIDPRGYIFAYNTDTNDLPTRVAPTTSISFTVYFMKVS